jgi:hypothetical protein
MNNFDSTTRVAMNNIMKKTSFKWGLFCILTILLFTVVAPNIDWIKSPLTPPIMLKVIDSDTNKPVPDMYVVFRWVANHSYFPGQGTGKSSHIYIGRTNQDGEINVGRKIKPIAVFIPPIFYREFGGIYLFSVDNRYKWAAKSVSLNGKTELQVKRILNTEDLIENYKKYDSWTKYNESVEVTRLCELYRDEAVKMAGR